MSDANKVVICGASFYEQKYYLNPMFDKLPEAIKNELKIMCVLFTEDIGGVFKLIIGEDKELKIEVEIAEDDYQYDHVGCELKIKQIHQEKQELLESVELFYRVFYLHEKLEWQQE